MFFIRYKKLALFFFKNSVKWKEAIKDKPHSFGMYLFSYSEVKRL